MRILLLQLAAGSLVLLTACERNMGAPDSRLSPGKALVNNAPGQVLATFQTKGRAQRASATNLTAYLNIAALPETHEVVAGLVAKVSTLLSRSDISSNLVASIGTPALASALNATIEFDSFGDLRRSKTGQLFGSIGWRTSDEQHASLNRQFGSSMSNQAHAPLILTRNGTWSVLAFGEGAARANVLFAKELSRGAEFFRRSTNWMDLTVNLGMLGTPWPASSGSQSNQLHLTLSPRGDGLRTEIHWTSDRPFDLQLGAWNVPTNTIRDPLTGFTALQGFGRWIQEQPIGRTLGLSNFPNQAYLWSQGITPFSVSVAAPLDSPRAAVYAVAEKLLPTFKSTLAPLGVGNFQVFTNIAMLVWRDLPIAHPFLRPAPAPETNFIYGGLFPLAELGNKKPPAELIAQVTSRSNLVYYDWEITDERINQWRQISQLAQIIEQHFSGSTNLLSDRWLNRIQAQLGNCVTEVSLSNPRQLTLVRRSAIGLNSVELVSLARWLDPLYTKSKVKKMPPHAPPFAPGPKS